LTHYHGFILTASFVQMATSALVPASKIAFTLELIKIGKKDVFSIEFKRKGSDEKNENQSDGDSKKEYQDVAFLEESVLQLKDGDEEVELGAGKIATGDKLKFTFEGDDSMLISVETAKGKAKGEPVYVKGWKANDIFCFSVMDYAGGSYRLS